jgi:hypothetical protein
MADENHETSTKRPGVPIPGSWFSPFPETVKASVISYRLGRDFFNTFVVDAWRTSFKGLQKPDGEAQRVRPTALYVRLAVFALIALYGVSLQGTRGSFDGKLLIVVGGVTFIATIARNHDALRRGADEAIQTALRR